jgi:hypothetical protein
VPAANDVVHQRLSSHEEPGLRFASSAERGIDLEPSWLFFVGGLVRGLIVALIEFGESGQSFRVFTPEHLAAIALETGRAKDKARLLQFLE